MARTAAFIGHSFSDSDKEVVGRFLGFFDRVEGLGIEFSWDHAEDAEMKILSQKVKEKMEGKNLFIGICTAKEYAVDPGALTKGRFSPDILHGPRSSFKAKTSDWITQEIGYAIAKNMNLLILLEDGVRAPGGLQGDMEYIPFRRTEPSESFEKILEMIRSLSPKLTNVEPLTSPPTARQSDTEKVSEDESLIAVPDTNWPRSLYENALFSAAFRNDEDRIMKLLDAFANTNEGKESIELDSMEAYAIWSRYLSGTEGSYLRRLEELAAKHSTDPRFARYLARCYDGLGSTEKAIDSYIAASKLEGNLESKAVDLQAAAIVKAKRGDHQAETWFRGQFEQPLEAVTQFQVLRRGLLELANINNKHSDWIAYQEARLIDIPDETDDRFALAYKYSQQNNDVMALYHYLLIPLGKRTSVTWNNIGVCYRNLEVPARSVAAYRTAERMGGTLAISNLANLFIEAGFLPEAETMCLEALKIENCDKRVAAALAEVAPLVCTGFPIS
jgi:tetratricopeptide (TPR) repeat protein